MRAQPREFQGATLAQSAAGSAGQAIHSDAPVGQSEIHVLAGDRINGAGAISSARGEMSTLDLRAMSDVRKFGSGSLGRLSETLSNFPASVTVRWSWIAASLVAAFGLGVACASLFDSIADPESIPVERNADLSLGRFASDKSVWRHHKIASATAHSSLAPNESSRPRLSGSAAKTLISSAVAQLHAEPQGRPSQAMLEGASVTGSLSASSDASPPAPLVAVPETRPVTIAGWTVRDVYGERATLVGPDHVWTVRTGDTVPGVGRIDTIVRWGSRWIVATTAGLISTD